MAKGIGFTELSIDQTINLKLEKLLAKYQIEHHIELFMAIAEYMGSVRPHRSIADLFNPPELIAFATRLQCLKTALCHLDESAESKSYVQSTIEAFLKRHEQTDDPVEKMLTLRELYLLNGVNVANDKKMAIENRIKLVEQEHRKTSIGFDESSERQYHEKIGKNMLLHKCVNLSADEKSELDANKELGQNLDTMENQARKLEQMYHSGCQRGVDYLMFSNQVDRIIRYLKLFQKR